MFLNISNHPMTKWAAEQLAAARELGNGMIEYIQFPNVPPTATTEEVCEIAKRLVSQIIETNPTPGVAMVQGEFTLTYELSRRLMGLGWTVVVATTERKVVEGEGGTKTATFEFIQFRALRN